MEITINGNKIEHLPGDSLYYVWFGSETGKPSVRDSLSIGKIEIDEDGQIQYYDSDGTHLSPESMMDAGIFWTREEAEKYLSENFHGGIPLYQPYDEIFMLKGEDIIPLKLKWADFLLVKDGKVVYDFGRPGIFASSFYVEHNSNRFVNDYNGDICPIVFTSYQDAQDYRGSNKERRENESR